MVVRPDRYYYGTYADADELDAALRGLVVQVAPQAVGAPA